MVYHEKLETTIKEIVNYYSDKLNEEDIASDTTEIHCRCWHCGDKSKLYRCHIIPSSAGGEDIPSNYVLLCRRCHEEAPNCINSNIMWDWLKRDCSQIHDYYWGTKIIRLYNLMYNNDFFKDYNSRYNLNGELLSKIIMAQFNNVKLHIGSGHFNVSTWVGLFKMAFIEFDKAYQQYNINTEKNNSRIGCGDVRRVNISEELRNKATQLYQNKDLTLKEIAKLVGVCDKTLQLLYREEFVKGTLKPRREAFALKPRVPNGQGTSKYVPTGVGSGGQNRKISKEMEQEIAKDYYNSNCTALEFMKKWNLHPVQLQRIRKTYGENFSKKKVGRRKLI